MGGPGLGIVIPALNEAGSIGSVVARARAFGLPIVVDDGSVDSTVQVARSAGAEVVRHRSNRAYDHALNSGFAKAADIGCEVVITMDADGQHDPLFIGRLVAEIGAGADVVIGVRDRRQRLAEHVFAWVSRRLWGIRDPLCGMKACRTDVYRELGHFDSYLSIGTELALFAARGGDKISQIPIQTRQRVGAPRFACRLHANWLIFRALLLALRVSSRRVPARADVQ